MPGLFSRLKNWINLENLTNEDLNDEFNNILNNFIPSKVDDYSASVAQMQTQTDPGDVGSESQATTLAGEIERLRYQIDAIIGGDYWYSSPNSSLADVQSYFNGLGQLSGNRIVSGRKDANNQPMFLVPSGSTNTVTLKCSTTPFVCYIDGVQYSFTSDIALAGLTTAPSSQNTAVITNSDFATDDDTKVAGLEYVMTPVFITVNDIPKFQERQIELGTIGTGITALNNVPAVYKLITGGNSEYIYGPLQDSDKFTAIKRAWFFDSSDNHIPAIALTQTTSTVQLMKASWIFLKSAGTLDVTYNPPIYSSTEPSSPNTGDYWFDYANDTWKRYNGSSYVAATAVFVGICAQDTSNTVCARSQDFFGIFSNENTISLNQAADTSALTTLYPRNQEQRVSVFGKTFLFSGAGPRVNYSADKESAFTVDPEQWHPIYVTDEGSFKWSNIHPIRRHDEGLGWCHPAKPWRCVGFTNDSGSSTFGGRLFNLSDFENEYEIHWNFDGHNGDLPVSISYNNATLSVAAGKLEDIIVRGRGKRMVFKIFGQNGFSYTRNTSTGAVGSIFTFQLLDAKSGSAGTAAQTTIQLANQAATNISVFPISSIDNVTLGIVPERDWKLTLSATPVNNSHGLSLSSGRLSIGDL